MAQINGDAFSNTLTGDIDSNVDDTLYGLAGNDILSGLTGNDLLDGGAGADIMLGGSGDDTYVVDNAGDVVIENANEGDDLVLSSISYTLTQNVENLTLIGTAIRGTGNDADNHIVGNGASNIIDGGAGNDVMEGGAGSDTYYVDSQLDQIIELPNQGTDQVYSSVSYTLADNVERLTLLGTANLSATGNAAANTLIGNAGDNVLDGGDGNDVLDGGAGIDRLIGGNGNDIYIIDNASEIVLATPDAGTDLVRSSVDYTLGANQENLTLIGSAVSGTGNSAGNIITGNALANILVGGDGNDTLDGGAGIDVLVGGNGNDTYVIDNAGEIILATADAGVDTVKSSVDYTLGVNQENLTLIGSALFGTGNAGNNIIIGNALDNTLTSGGGNDTLNGGLGADTLIGGAGNDILVVDNVGDVVVEAAGGGIDTVQASITYVLGSQVENLTLTGTADIDGSGNLGDNIIKGNAGANVLYGGGGGVDSLSGGAGDDTYIIDSAGDVVTEAAASGTDLVRASIDYTLGANVENLTLVGTAVNGVGNSDANVITGNAADNVLDGMAGADTLLGGAGNDVLIYDAADVLVDGGSGSDTLRVVAPLGVLDLTTQTNLKGIERIDLTDSGATLNLSSSAVAALSDTDKLTIDGAAGAAVTVSESWTYVGDFSGYARYQANGATLDIALAITRTGISAAALPPPNTAPVNSLPLAPTALEDQTVVFSKATGNALSVADAEGDVLSTTLSVQHGVLQLAQTTGLNSLLNNGTASVTLSGSAAAINAALDGLHVQPNANYNGSEQLTMVTSDGQLVTSNSLGFSIAAINDAPVNRLPGAQSIVQGHALTLSGANALSVSDVDAGSAALSVNLSVSSGSLTLSTVSGLSGDTSGADGHLLFSGTLAAINTALNGLIYNPASSFVGTATMTMITNDGGNSGAGGPLQDSDSLAIAVTPTFTAPSSIDVTLLNGSNGGFKLTGNAGSNNVTIHGDLSGYAVDFAGDVNGDGYADLVIGAPNADPGKTNASDVTRDGGKAYVVFGNSTGALAALTGVATDGDGDGKVDGYDLGTLNSGVNGLELSGSTTTAQAVGDVVHGVGDVNGDGFDDFGIGRFGAPSADQLPQIMIGNTDAGLMALPNRTSTDGFAMASVDGSNGFTLHSYPHPSATFIPQHTLQMAGAGDIDGDGFKDVIFGNAYADAGTGDASGESYVVFGNPSAASLNTLTSTTNPLNSTSLTSVFRFVGAAGAYAGTSVSGIGDINGDGFDDFMIGSKFENNGYAGKAYVVFGDTRAHLQASLTNVTTTGFNLASLNGTRGFIINGAAVNHGYAGASISSAGDVNGDGFDDLVIGAPGDGGIGAGAAGNAYVVFGKATGFGTIDLGSLNGSNGFRISGFTGEALGAAVHSAGDFNGDGYDDIVIGAPGASQAYILYGKSSFAASFSVGSSATALNFDGVNGVALNGALYSKFGYSVSGGYDFNGDGFADVAIGAPNYSGQGGAAALQYEKGQVYVIYGFDGLGQSVGQTLTASAVGQHLVGGAGNDTLSSGAHAGVSLRGGSGDDALCYFGGETQLDGGNGVDTLVFGGSNLTLDFSAIDAARSFSTTATRFASIEAINLDGLAGTGNNNTLRVTAGDVLDLVDNKIAGLPSSQDNHNVMKVLGDGDDHVRIANTTGHLWTAETVHGATVSGYTAYFSGDATLLVQQTIIDQTIV